MNGQPAGPAIGQAWGENACGGDEGAGGDGGEALSPGMGLDVGLPGPASYMARERDTGTGPTACGMPIGAAAAAAARAAAFAALAA